MTPYHIDVQDIQLDVIQLLPFEVVGHPKVPNGASFGPPNKHIACLSLLALFNSHVLHTMEQILRSKIGSNVGLNAAKAKERRKTLVLHLQQGWRL